MCLGGEGDGLIKEGMEEGDEAVSVHSSYQENLLYVSFPHVV